MKAWVECAAQYFVIVQFVYLWFYYSQDKIAAGADFVLTQFFYDTQMFIKYLARCRAAHITCPIIPGAFFKSMMGASSSLFQPPLFFA